MRALHTAFARLVALDPTLRDRVLREFSRADIEQLATQSGLSFHQVRGALYRFIFHRTWRIKLLLVPTSAATPRQRHWALITLQARLVSKGLRQVIPAGWPPPKPLPVKPGVMSRQQQPPSKAALHQAKADKHYAKTTIRKPITLTRYKF